MGKEKIDRKKSLKRHKKWLKAQPKYKIKCHNYKIVSKELIS